jgi:DNA-binding MarR family transcriptional regulator
MADEVRWLDHTEMEAWRGLLEVTTRLLSRLDDDLGPHGLSLAEYEVLVQLSDAPDDRLRMTELAERSLVSRSGLTRRVDGLERRGLVRRETCSSDRRGANAVLTDAGRLLLAEVAPVHVDGVRRHLFDHLRPDQVQALADALGSVDIPGQSSCSMDDISAEGHAKAATASGQPA